MFTIALAQTVEITQATVIAILAASTVVVVALIAYFASRTPINQEGGPLHFGNFFGSRTRRR
jgi:hypothetical protein